MLKVVSSKPLYIVLRVLLGGVFVYAGILKLADPAAFAQAIDGYGLVSWRMANLISRSLPVLEILSGIGLIFDVRGSLGMIVAQLLGFMGVLAYGIHMGLDVDCGCFGPSDPGAGAHGGLWGTLVRDMFMFAACLIIFWQRRVAGYFPRPLFRFNPFKTTE
ncbi:MauE/DoxX family redox-associated membrane protein [Pseudodesulfovibrio piezophilus]|uniref:DoxX family protein n=1 Tax=Pseudodesulfovibrio piezophilus (strain DSM 21447 / JCM 15486 / C1TLV30) TaxID=1322246 RepID=M1WTK6_PSEP2|nr:MauE/DoxX family redox-associated membrane protein [Pseudodesulfovibrio piezophilus]CCH49672.1 DoxX family protein [Pseudodesulfovibrio piezophilus C1TLV30]